MISQALELTIIGMGVVFSFLALLVIIMRSTYHLVQFTNRFFPEKVETAPARAAGDNNEEIAVVLAAVRAFQE